MWNALHCICDTHLDAEDVEAAAANVVLVASSMDDEHLQAVAANGLNAPFAIMNYESQSALGQG